MSDEKAILPAELQGESSSAEPLGSEQFSGIEARLGYSFVDRNLLELALTHRSVQSRHGVRSDYERLEFLGDAVLDLAVAELLLNHYEDADEGLLSKMRAAIVNTASLADVARKIELGPFIRLSRGELANRGAERPSILADVLESVMGAVYRDGGFPAALAITNRLLGEKIRSVTPRDPKTELQELLHARGEEAPTYLLDCIEGPEHAPVFLSTVRVNGVELGRGRGSTKKGSQQAAAAMAIAALANNSAEEESTISGQDPEKGGG